MLWAFLGVMLLAALLVVLWPLYRAEGSFGTRAALVCAIVVLVSGLYYQTGQPGVPSASAPLAGAGPAPGGDVPSVEDMVTSLAARLAENPDDVDGWKMLGRSYAVTQRYPEAITAFEKAVALEGSANGETLVDLGEAVFLNDNQTLSGRAGELFERSLDMGPGNQKALFYSGLAAAERGERALAADRWERLLATSPPPEIQNVLSQRIAEWRGVAPQAAPVATVAEAAGLSLTVSVALGDAAAGAVDPSATVFIIARDPAQPSPPIAAVRRRAAELPADITLSDSDAMIPGRNLSNYQELEIVVRASGSGQPIAQSGDWFGSQRIDVAEARSLKVVIDQRVP